MYVESPGVVIVRRSECVQTTTKRKRGRLERNYWLETFRKDLKICNLIEEIALNRVDTDR